MVAEIVRGWLQLSPRHTVAASVLGTKFGNPFGFGDGGPGGWWILDAAERRRVALWP